MPNPSTGMVKFPSGRDLTVIVSNLAGRKPFPSGIVTSAEWDKSAMGGDGRFTISCQAVPGISALPQLAHDDLVQIWSRGLLRYQGVVSEIARSREKMNSLTISGYGLWQRVGGINTDRQYVYPVDADISQVARDIATDSITPLYPLLEVDAQTLGRTVSSLDGTGKTVGDVYSDLLKVAGDRGAYGIDRNPVTNTARLFVRPFALSVPVHVLSADHKQLTAVSSEEQSADIVTRLRIQGGTPRFPNLVPNASFERPRLSSEKDNLVRNGGLDEPDPTKGYWFTYSGASFKTGNNSEGATYAGDRMVETDFAGEGFYQRRENYSKIVAGHDYAIAAYIKREAGNNNATGTIAVKWLNASNVTIKTDVLGTDIVFADSVLWRRVGSLLRAPDNAVGFEIRCECVNPSLLWDAISFYDASLVVQNNWRQDGGGTVQLLDWAHPGALHGGYCVRVKATAADQDGQDVCIISDRFPVATKQRLRASFWIKSPAGVTSNPKLRFKVKLWNSNGEFADAGTASLDPLLTIPAGAGWATWTKYSVEFDCPFFNVLFGADAKPATAEIRVIMRGSGEIMLDAFSVRDAASDANEPYVPDGAYQLTVGPRDVLPNTDALYNAEDVWGIRFATEQVDSITSWPDVKSFAASYFSTRAKLSKRPEITLVGMWEKNFEPGEGLRINGAAAILAEGTMPIVSIKERIDAEGLTSRLQLERVRPTVEGIVRDMNRKARYGAGAATGSVSSSGGSASGGGGSSVPGVYVTPPTGVTSVALSAPDSLFSVSGSPITTAGTLSLTLLAQGANLVWAGPVNGANAAPGFRSLVTNDLPALGVTTDKIAPNAVTRAKVGMAAIGTNELADQAVTGAKLEDVGVNSGTYTNATITVDAKGRVTGVASGTGGGGGGGALAIRPVLQTDSNASRMLTSGDDVIEAADTNNIVLFNLPLPSSLTRKPYYFYCAGVGLTMITAQNNTIELKLGDSIILVPGTGAFFERYAISTSGGTPGGTSGQLQFNNANSFGGASRLYWDTANLKFGIGTTAPQHLVHVAGQPFYNGNSQSLLLLDDTSTSALGVGGGIAFSGRTDGAATGNVFAGIKGIKENGTSGDLSAALVFSTNRSSGSPIERLRLTSGGNLLFSPAGDSHGLTLPTVATANVTTPLTGALVYEAGRLKYRNATTWVSVATLADITSGGTTPSVRTVQGASSDLVQTDDTVRLDASTAATTLILRNNLTASKEFSIKRTDSSSNTCQIQVSTESLAAVFLDGTGTPATFALPPRGGVRLLCYRTSTSGPLYYEIIAVFNGASGGMSTQSTNPAIQSLD